MASIIDLPDFMFNNLDKDLNLYQKVYYFVKGLVVAMLYSKLNGKAFCNFINLLFREETKIKYSENLYNKNIYEDVKIYYPNKRIDRVIINPIKNFEILYKSYCLDFVEFKKNNVVVDCGANVGELYHALKLKNIEFNYFAFEPDNAVFECLKLNVSENSTLHNIALSNRTEIEDFYLDTQGADSSLLANESNKVIKVQTEKIDEFEFDHVTLLKLEAEGTEPEVLEGATKTLKKIEYIAVDYGPERGVSNDTTLVEVTNFLYKNNFFIVKDSRYRKAALFKNKNIFL